MAARELETSPTLLGKLCNGPSDESWGAFVDRYAPTVFSWAERAGLQESDAADVTQEVLLKLLDQMKTFEYQPAKGSFRAWLKTITVNAARDVGRKISRRKGSDAGLSSVAAPSPWDELALKMDEKYERELLSQASVLVESRVASKTWLAYYRTAVENLPAADVAAQLGVQVSDVYVAKSRVIQHIRKTVGELEQIDAVGPSGEKQS